MSEWLPCYRIAQASSKFEAKRAKGGEKVGFGTMFAKSGEWICRNPENGHTWVCSDEGFEQLYCEAGKSPVKKIKKQQDGHKKGKSRHHSASSEVVDHSHGELFEETDEQQVEEEGEVDGDMV